MTGVLKIRNDEDRKLSKQELLDKYSRQDTGRVELRLEVWCNKRKQIIPDILWTYHPTGSLSSFCYSDRHFRRDFIVLDDAVNILIETVDVFKEKCK